MNLFEVMLAKWLSRRIVMQGNHIKKITQLFSIVHKAASEEFTEDNPPTLNAMLLECFKKGVGNF